MSSRSTRTTGLLFALLSATSFGLSGSIARGLMDAGWTSAASVSVRVLLASVVLLPLAHHQLAGRWDLLRGGWKVLLAYGAIAVAGCQLAYFNAVAHMQVGVAMLVEYLSPVAVVAWLWLRHGQRPSRTTAVGAGVAMVGLVLVLDLLSGVEVSGIGLLWALGAMAGAATYFVMSSDESHGLPASVLAAGGLLCGGLVLLAAGILGVLPFAATTAAVTFRGVAVPWWVPVLALGVVTAAVAYTAGIAATRRLGSMQASFVGLAEVLAALLWAGLLLAELPSGIQVVGVVLVLLGVVVVQTGERARGATVATLPEPVLPSEHRAA